MFLISSCRWLALAPLLAAAAALAQQAPLAPIEYRSALQGYQPYSEEKTLPWKGANETVGQIGGWREYAREAAEGKKPDAKQTHGNKPDEKEPEAKPHSHQHAPQGGSQR